MISRLAANQVLDECASTNDLARALGEAGYPHGTWISARRQTSGRGRVGRDWSSLEGNLFLSLLLRIEDKKHWTWVPLAIAVGVARELKRRRFDVRIKWPNDLWISEAKLAGILCEAVGSQSGSFIVAGLGLNCLHSPEGVGQAVTSLAEHRAAAPLSADDVRADLIQSILAEIESLSEHGPCWLTQGYDSMAAFEPGSLICWEAHPEGAKVEGLGSAGELRVRDLEGKELRLYAEEIRAVRRAAGGSRP